MGEITVRPVGPDDADALAMLLREVDRFYGDEDVPSVAEKIAGFYDTLFGGTPVAAALLAWAADKPVGLPPTRSFGQRQACPRRSTSRSCT